MSTDFENGFAHDPTGVAETVELAVATGLAGCSVEDFAGRDAAEPIYDLGGPMPVWIRSVATIPPRTSIR